MPLTRDTVLKMLQDYLEGKISQESIYQWALDIVVSKEFDRLLVDDKLLAESVQVLFDLHHEGVEEKFNPTIEELKYFKDCLEGKIEFSPTKRTKRLRGRTSPLYPKDVPKH